MPFSLIVVQSGVTSTPPCVQYGLHVRSYWYEDGWYMVQNATWEGHLLFQYY
jgi:hypothetical protein